MNVKKNPYFINTSRGEIVNEQALLMALKKKLIKGAAIDVLQNEQSLNLSKNKLVRGISNILYESIGKTGKNWVRSRTMSQVKNFELNRQRTLYYKNWVSNYDAWLKENGYKRIHLDGITKREEFNELVA